MDAERYQHLRALFHEGAALTPEGRPGWLDRVCAGEPEMRRELERLLASQAVLTGQLVAPPPAAERGAEGEVRPGERVGPYEVVRLLGRGGMGSVYLARGPGPGGPVALKVFHPHLVGAGDISTRIEREAEMGRRVRHENVVRTLDAGTAAGPRGELRYLVMDFVEGRTLRALLAEHGTVPEALLREIARQVAAGLAAIHAQGIVHRDLKPENILISTDRRVQIMDLGVAKSLFASHTLTLPGHFVGSLAYAAPEQTDGSGVGPAADLYALGTVLFELASGEVPFAGATFAELLHARATRPAPPLRERAPGASAFFSEVVGVLLARDPRERFASAEELADVLALQEAGAWWRARRGARASGRLEVVVDRPTSLQGRQAELDGLLEAWREARQGRGGAVLLEGEAGLGKSRLLDALLRTVEVQDAEVVYASYAHPSGRVGVRGALVHLLGERGLGEALAPLLGDLGEQAGRLARALLGEPTAPGEVALTAAQVAGALAEVCAGLAERRPLLFLVDDLHLAPVDLKGDVLALARAATRGRMLCVVATRPPGVDPEWRALGALPRARRLALTRLGLEGVAEVAREFLEDEMEARSLAPQLHRRSDGIPYHLLELLRAVKARGAALEPGTLGDLPPALGDLVQVRLDGLARPELALLEAAAVQGPVFDVDLLAAVRGVPRLETLETLAHLERHTALVRSQGMHARFDHHLVQEVLYERMMPALRAEYHALTAEALARRGGDPWRIVHHHLHGSRPEGALEHLDAALDHLERTQEHREASRVGLRALALAALPRDARRLGLLLRLAGRLGSLPDVETGKRLCREAHALAAELGDPQAACRARLRASSAHLLAAEYAHAEAEARQAEAEARAAGAARIVGESLSIQGQVAWSQGRYDEARALQLRVLEVARETGSEPMAARALSNLGVIEQELGSYDAAARYLRQARETFERLGDHAGLVPATTNLGNVLFDRGLRAEALALYQRSLELDHELGSREGLAIGWVNVAEARMHMGDFAGAHAALDRSLGHSRALGARRVEGYGLQGRGQVLALEGRLAEATAALEAALALRRELGEAQAVTNTLIWLARVAVEAGRPAAAGPWLDEAEATARRAGLMGELASCLALRARSDPARVPEALALLGQHEGRLGHDAHFEVRYQLWKATGDATHRDIARGLLEHLRRNSPAEWREPMVEAIAHFREVVGVGGD